jgi:hypothetical protein
LDASGFCVCVSARLVFAAVRDSLRSYLLQLVYHHTEKGGRLSIDGHIPFRQYHLGPCSNYTSVFFGGISPLVVGQDQPFHVRTVGKKMLHPGAPFNEQGAAFTRQFKVIAKDFQLRRA